MRVAGSIVLLLAFAPLASAQAPAPSTSLDYEYFKTRVQPIFLAERAGHARCIACHGSGTPLHDHSDQFQAFTYFDHILDDTSRVSAILGTSQQSFEIPNRRGLQPDDAVVARRGV